MNNVLSYTSFAVAIAALVMASQSAVGEKPSRFTGTHVVYTLSEPAIASAWVYYPSQFENKAKRIEALPAQF